MAVQEIHFTAFQLSLAEQEHPLVSFTLLTLFLNVIAGACNLHFQNNLVTNHQFPREAILLAEFAL